ncbi:MAG TPA: hypothetical protein VHL11_15140, partial [Phototrophicaceae bacterium]|nr:hypothetical protein [Phototrophicaceae bacterium]
EIPLHEIMYFAPDYVEGKDEITIEEDYEDTITVDLHNGASIRLKKLGRDHDPRNRHQAIAALESATRENTFLTGLIYYEEPRMTLGETLNVTSTPLSQLPESKLRPSRDALADVMKKYM